MKLDISITINWPQADRILDALTDLKRSIETMAQDISDLTAKVARNTDVIESAKVLIEGFAAQLAAAGTDPVALKALGDSLTTEDDALAAAVVANTPAAPPTT